MRYIQRTQVTNACVLVRIGLGYLASRTRMGPRFDVLLSISAKTRLAVIVVGGLGLAPLMHPSKIAAHFSRSKKIIRRRSGGGDDHLSKKRFTGFRIDCDSIMSGASRFIFQGAAVARFVLFNRRSGVREISKRELRLVNKIIRPKTETLCK
jgi:hypothetical protein